jgi:hypothetical protein
VKHEEKKIDEMDGMNIIAYISMLQFRVKIYRVVVFTAILMMLLLGYLVNHLDSVIEKQQKEIVKLNVLPAVEKKDISWTMDELRQTTHIKPLYVINRKGMK